MGKKSDTRSKQALPCTNLHAGIAIYLRVSTENQVRGDRGQGGRGATGSSVETQIYRCQQFIAIRYPEVDINDLLIYRDDGHSGKDLNRPGFQRLLKDSKSGLVRHIIFTDLSRISRDVRDFLDLSDLFNSHGVALTSLRENIDTSSPSGKMIVSILMSLAQFEREQTALRVRTNMKSRAERGLFNGGFIPLGYKPDPQKPGYLIINEEDARIVRTVYKTYMESGSIKATAEKLSESGVRRPGWTAGKTGRRHEGGYLNVPVIQGILTNPVYTARRVLNRQNKALSPEENAALPIDEQYRLEDAVWPPIIQVTLFNRIQEQLNENARKRKNPVAIKHHNWFLTGVVFCKTCGAQLQGASAKGNGGQFFCYKHPASSPKMPECKKNYYPAELLEEVAIERLRIFFGDPDIETAFIKLCLRRIETETPELEANLGEARARSERLAGEMRAFAERLMQWSLRQVPESFVAAVNEKEAALQVAKNEISKIEQALASYRAKLPDLNRLRVVLRDFSDNFTRLTPTEQGGMALTLIEKIEVDGEDIVLTMPGETPEIVEILGERLNDKKRNRRTNRLTEGSPVNSLGSPGRV